MRTWRKKIRDLWMADQIHGIELVFDTVVIALRHISLSYWSKDCWLNKYLNWRRISDDRRRRIWRDNLIDTYCLLQLFALWAVLFLFLSPAPGWWGKFVLCFLAGYILFEMYLNLFSIFFLPRQKEIGTPKLSDSPSAINEPSTSVERSILLLFVNVLQIVLAFAIFYKISKPCLTPSDAFSAAVFVFGTVGTPNGALPLLVALQIFLDFLLVASILASFVGQAGPFAKKQMSSEAAL
jgi:hypothetical protein